MVSLPTSGTSLHVAAPTARLHTGSTWLVLLAPGPAGTTELHGAGSTVVLASDPDELIRLIVEIHPRIVVCAEPPADAVIVETVARERLRRPGLRVVHLAPRAAVSRRLAALDAGFDDALPIDIAPAELVGRLAWLDRRSSDDRPAGSLVTIAPGTVLDRYAHVVTRDGQEVHLRPKEFALLSLLASHPGRAFSREELVHLVFGPDRSTSSRTVDVHVRWLRTKVEPNPGLPVHLVTVRGTGYRLDPPR